MNVCKICGEWKKRGKRQGLNFTCSDCLAKINANSRKLGDRRERLPDGRIRYPYGNVIALPREAEK